MELYLPNYLELPGALAAETHDQQQRHPTNESTVNAALREGEYDPAAEQLWQIHLEVLPDIEDSGEEDVQEPDPLPEQPTRSRKRKADAGTEARRSGAQKARQHKKKKGSGNPTVRHKRHLDGDEEQTS
ncbi:hypothetical protein BJV82DRAFT_578011 [Fennellomyces sp. T-0311]|nr:hypothetical protein BJV82DRAFT_578011 [Fennellomyces sp. T-0311]